jgi:hypothetical protein
MTAVDDTGTSDWAATKAAAERLLDEGDTDGAIRLLESAATNGSGDADALIGLARFLGEDYSGAAESFDTALAASPDQSEWQHLADLARANAEAEVSVHIPPVHYFDKDEVLAPPQVPAGTLPSPPPPVVPTGWVRLRDAGGEVIGRAGGWLMHQLSALVGRISGYRGEVWTNWYRKRFYGSVLTLAYMRDLLNKRNLRTTYPPGTKIGFAPDGLRPPDGVTHFRTADGTWNNLDDPMEGAAGTRFPRNVRNEAIRPASDDELLNPNPRQVSLELLTRGDEMKEVPFLNLLAASWIQFQNHDWITHGENLSREIIEIPLPEDDPARERFRQSKMFVGRTQPDPTRRDDDVTPVTFLNEVTHWWDGSQIYGSDQETQDRLRSGVDGKLRLNDDGTLPVDGDGVEDTGMVRNWWIGLSMLHDLFAREHNAICDHLTAAYPDWDDNRLFNVARLVNAAVMAKIHSVEWTPAILPNHVLDLALNANWYGLLTYRLRKPENRKTVANLNVHNPELGGVVGNRLNKHDSPYGLTEEFVEVYRLHSLLPEELRLRDLETDEVIEEVPFPASRQAGSPKITERAGMANLFYSFGNQHPGQLVLNNFPRFMQELAVPGNPVFDMGAIDLLRARERGIPRYNEFRRQLGLNPIRRFEDLTDDADIVAKLKKLYGDGPEDVEKLDLLIGTLGEAHRPTMFGFGETMFQIFILNATRRLQADRFYTDDYREEVYTAEGLRWVDESSFKKVILRHFPELEKTGLGNVKNAFEPWDTDARLDPGRHPLRGYDPSLKGRPWVGDAAAPSD